MNGLSSFFNNPAVLQTGLGMMAVSSLLLSIRRFKTIDNTPVAPGMWAKFKLIWNFFFDWLTNFWSMKTGNPPIHPLEAHSESTLETTPGGTLETKSSTLSTEAPAVPLVPPATPATTK